MRRRCVTIKTYEKVNLQDLIFAKAFNISKDEVSEMYLHQMKNSIHNKAFQMRENNQVISQEEANELNNTLEEIEDQLIELGYDSSYDYYINFNSFVVDNEYYNKFAW